MSRTDSNILYGLLYLKYKILLVSNCAAVILQVRFVPCILNSVEDVCCLLKQKKLCGQNAEPVIYPMLLR